MCGFAGFIDLTRDAARETLLRRVERMARTLVHRGPDDQGSWADPAAGIALGFRRLSIVDVSSEGHQPMISETGRFVLVFNGEVYNHRALRDALSDGIPYRGHSDTEIMLRAFERWGLAGALARFVGMYAFALWDRHERVLHLGRDRLGEKPLFYGWVGDSLVFGSELKALQAHPEFRGQIDRDVLIPYLRHGWIPAPYSIYKGIYKLSHGSTLTIRTAVRGRLPDPDVYWFPKRVMEQGEANRLWEKESDWTDALERLLKDAIRDEMIADVPVGAFLSGGVDSSTVVALMQAQTDRPVKTFSIGFKEPGFDEAPYAAAVAAHLGTDHTERYVSHADSLALIPKLPLLYDEPFGDPSQIPLCLLSELARRSVTVGLSGDGGDELFGGYQWYRWSPLIWRGIGWLPASVRKRLAIGVTGISVNGWDRAFTTLGPVLPARLRTIATGDRMHKFGDLLDHADGVEDVYRYLTSKWHPSTSVVLNAVEPSTLLSDRNLWPDVEVSQRMMFADMNTYLPDNHMTKVDRASMAVSLEVRAPFLDHRVAEFACRVPIAMKLRGNRGKHLVREVLVRHVPRKLVERPKMGFPVPIESWLRNELRGWAEDLLAEERLVQDGFFDPVIVRQKWTEHLSGRRRWPLHLWHVLMFQSWLDAQPNSSSRSTASGR